MGGGARDSVMVAEASIEVKGAERQLMILEAEAGRGRGRKSAWPIEVISIVKYPYTDFNKLSLI